MTLIGLMAFFAGSVMPTGSLHHPSVDTRRDQAITPVEQTGLSLLEPAPAFAQRRGFGRAFRSSRSLWNRKSFSRSSSRSALFSSRSKQTAQPSRTANRARSTGAASPARATNARSTGASARAGGPVARSSAMTTRVNQAASKKALETHQTRQARFAKPSNTAANTSDYKDSPLYQRGRTDRISYERYYDRRDAYYRDYGWSPPSYAYLSRPSFGMWDALILWSILDHLNDSRRYAMAYHHAGDPGYRQWRQEAEELAKDNAELRRKLDELDRKVAAMEGTPVDPGYLPPGVDPSIALAAETVATADPGPPVLRLGTGVPSGNYHRFGTILKTHLPDFDVTLVPSNGSEENLDRFIEARCDAILVQSDVLNAYLRENPGAAEKLIGLQSTLYTEFVQLLVNRRSGITGIRELDPKKHVVYVGPKGSGTHGAWRGFVVQDPAYGEFNTRHADYEEALRQVADNPDAVMLFVGGLNSDLLKQANDRYGDRIRLVAVDERTFGTALDQFGNTIYTFATIPHETYAHIQDGWIFGWFGDSSVETLKVEAVLILSQDWVDTYGSFPMTVVEDAVWRSIDEIEPVVGVR